MAYDPTRLDALRTGLSTALDDLHRIRSDDGAAVDAIRAIREACRVLGDRCLPRVRDILDSHAMTASSDTSMASCVAPGSVLVELARDRGWELTYDPLELNGAALLAPSPPFGPSLPRVLSVTELEAAIRCGQRSPMVVPTIPGHPHDRQFTTMWFTPTSAVQVGSNDLSSGALKLTDDLSDFSMFGWREHKELAVFYLSSVKVVSSVRAFDPDAEAGYREQLTAATASGYLVLNSDARTIQINIPLDPVRQRTPFSIPLTIDNDYDYSGSFYPDAPPEFQPTTPEQSSEEAARWTLTTLPIEIDGLGKWVADSRQLRFDRDDDDAQCTPCSSTG